MNLYVGNLPWSCSEEEIEALFAQYGDVKTVRIITDRDSGRSKGFGFVEMPNDSEGEAAIEGLNGSEVMERAMVVNQARPRE